MSRIYAFITHVQFNHLVEIADILASGANPDMSFAGVMGCAWPRERKPLCQRRPLTAAWAVHLAVECGHADLVAYLLHWGASKTRLNGSRRTALQEAKARCTRKETKGQTELNAELERLLTDEAYLKERVSALLPKLEVLRVEQRAELKRIRLRQAWQLFFLSTFLLVVAHLLVTFAPALAEEWLPAGFITHLRHYSPLLEAAAAVTPPGGRDGEL